VSRLAVAAVALVVACGSKTSPDEDAVKAMRALADEACGCGNRMCAEMVSAKVLHFDDSKASSTARKSISVLREKAETCVERAKAGPKKAEPAKPVEPAKTVEPPRPPKPSLDASKLPVPKDRDVMEMVKAARAAVAAIAPDLGLGGLDAYYVRKDGTLDPTYGTLALRFAQPQPTEDDPNRPTGAPIARRKPPVERATEACPRVKFADGAWKSDDVQCRKQALIGELRCTSAQVWARAIARGAPADAVAILELDQGYGSWKFRIEDKLRKVDFYELIADDCPAKQVANPSP
jgi:hypothetical protein